MANWVKTTPYGDYDDPLQNHKFDGEMQFPDDKLRIIAVRTRQHELLHQCRILMTHGKHVGSKPHKNLRNALKSMSKARALYNKMLKAQASKDAGNN